MRQENVTANRKNIETEREITRLLELEVRMLESNFSYHLFCAHTLVPGSFFQTQSGKAGGVRNSCCFPGLQDHRTCPIFMNISIILSSLPSGSLSLITITLLFTALMSYLAWFELLANLTMGFKYLSIM